MGVKCGLTAEEGTKGVAGTEEFFEDIVRTLELKVETSSAIAKIMIISSC